MKKAIPTMKHDELMKGATPLVFIPYGIYPSDFGTQLHVSIANLGVGGCLIRMQNVLEDEEGVSIQSENVAMALNLHLVESEKDHRLYLYDDLKNGTKNVNALLEDGEAWFDDIPETPDIKGTAESQDLEEGDPESLAVDEMAESLHEDDDGYDRDEAASKIDNMTFEEKEEDPEPEQYEEEEEESDLQETLDNTPDDDEDEPNEDIEKQDTNDELTAGDIANKLREAGIRAEVKDNEKQITYVNAPESKPYSKEPYHPKKDRDKKHNKKWEKKGPGRYKEQQAPVMNRNIDFGAIAGSMFK